MQDAEDFETEDEEDSQADGFVVDDGYLSEGEGAPIDNDDFGAEVEGILIKGKILLQATLNMVAQSTRHKCGCLFWLQHCAGGYASSGAYA